MSKTYKYRQETPSSIDEYLDRLNRLERTPTVADDYSDIHVHKFQPENHHVKTVNLNNGYRAPEAHRKVHFTEHETDVEINRKGRHEVCEEKTIDVEADGFIQKRHKNFETCGTFKGY